MSYLDVINAFWRYNRRERLEPTIALTYLWMLDLWNRVGRKEWFDCTLDYLSAEVRTSKSTAARNVHKLARKGLLKVQKSHRRAPNKYLINTGLFESLCRQRTTNESTNRTQPEHKRVPYTEE